MLKIGLTGGIGSGKSTVARVFEKLGTPIFYADDEAKKVLLSDEVKKNLFNHWGDVVFFSDGDVNKAALANIVLNNADELQILNNFIHPLLITEFEKWTNKHIMSDTRYIILEAAILFGAGFHMLVDKTICVTARDDQRIKRVRSRDNASEEQVESRMNSQWPQNKVAEISDFEINNSDGDMILESIITLHKTFIN